MKKWDYEQITANAEKRIRVLAESGEHQWAYGVFIGWDSLTTGWQRDGDNGRLERLTEQPSGR